jgi:PAS domain S-box-containing protein
MSGYREWAERVWRPISDSAPAQTRVLQKVEGWRSESISRMALAALLVSLAYYLGAKIGFALTFQPRPISTLWPPNSILFAALLLTPTRSWWVLLLAALPAHFGAELQSGVPATMILCWFISNCSEALIGAFCIRRVVEGPLRFDSFQHVSIFVAYGVFLAPFLSSFLDAAFVKIIDWGQGSYWELWRMRFFSNMLATLVVVPLIITWSNRGIASVRNARLGRYAESALLVLGLLTVSIAVFNSQKAGLDTTPVLLYAPLPFLLWAAVRFGPRGTSAALLVVVLLAIWGAIHGQGPFVTSSPEENALSVQLFLIVVSIPLLFLAAVIEERGQAEEALREEAALRESEARLRGLADAMPQIVWAARPDGHVDYYNRRWYELTGAKETETGDASWLPVYHPDDRQRCLDLWYESVRTGKPFQIEHRLLLQEADTYRWHLGRALPVRDGAGNIVRWYGACTDIDDQKKSEQALREMREQLEQRVTERTAELSQTNVALRAEIAERRRATEALRRSEERFAKAFRSSPDAIAISRRVDGCIVDVNDKWESLFGHSRAEALGCTALELKLYANDKEREAFHKLGNAQGYVRDFEVELRNRAGEFRQAKLASEAMDVGREPCFITTIRDITEQRRAELEAQQQREQLTHLTRVAVLGELSGALAHELNQPLTAILSNAQAGQRFLSKEPVNLTEIREILADIVQEDKRAGEVIRRLRALLTKGKMQFLPLELNGMVNDALELARSDLIGRNVAVTKSLAPGLPTVHGDRVQLQQVLLNLILNACEAMAATEPADRKLTVVSKAGADRSAQVCISDRGTGIPADMLDRLFEPFYTTKAQGLGLGLSISRSIIAAHSGQIWAENNPDRGATFCLAFPDR